MNERELQEIEERYRHDIEGTVLVPVRELRALIAEVRRLESEVQRLRGDPVRVDECVSKFESCFTDHGGR